MKTKQFAQLAIKNGYTGSHTAGWEQIKDNLPSLTDIFQSKEYKQQNGMKYKCMPLIINNQNLSSLEESALATAWYLNNQVERKNKEFEYETKMLKEGWIKLTPEIVKTAFNNKQKLRINATFQNDWFNSKVDEVFKPFVNDKGTCFLMKPRARNKGYTLHYYKHAFCKIV